MSAKGNNPKPPPGTKRPNPPAAPPSTPAQAEIRDRIKTVKQKRQAIAEVVKCQACGVLVPVPAGSCYVCPNCGFNSGACG